MRAERRAGIEGRLFAEAFRENHTLTSEKYNSIKKQALGELKQSLRREKNYTELMIKNRGTDKLVAQEFARLCVIKEERFGNKDHSREDFSNMLKAAEHYAQRYTILREAYINKSLNQKEKLPDAYVKELGNQSFKYMAHRDSIEYLNHL